jgi:transposase InsO family protein
MRAKSEAGFALKELIQDVGIPKEIHTDGAKELTMGTWKQVCRDAGIKTTTTEKNSPWQNRAKVEETRSVFYDKIGFTVSFMGLLLSIYSRVMKQNFKTLTPVKR